MDASFAGWLAPRAARLLNSVIPKGENHFFFFFYISGKKRGLWLERKQCSGWNVTCIRFNNIVFIAYTHFLFVKLKKMMMMMIK